MKNRKDVEEQIIGECLSHQSCAIKAAEMFDGKPEHFHNNFCHEAFRVVLSDLKEGSVSDMLNASEKLADRLKIAQSDVFVRLLDFTNKAHPMPEFTEAHCEYLIDVDIKHDLARMAQDVVRMHEDSNVSHLQIIEVVEKKLNEVDKQQPEGAMTMQEASKVSLDRKVEALKRDGLIGISTGIWALDNFIGGLQEGHLVIIGGRPSMGKTTLALNIADVVSRKHGVTYVSIEMNESELVDRLVIANSQFTMNEIFTRGLQKNQLEQYEKDLLDLQDRKLEIDQSSDTVDRVLFRCKRAAMAGHRLVIVDYLQLITTEREELVRLTRALKNVAKRYGITILALSQLSRAVEATPNKVPMLSHLKESGSIEEDANMVLFPYRPEHYGIDEFEDGTPTAGRALILIAKNRGGRTGAVFTEFRGNKALFIDVKD